MKIKVNLMLQGKTVLEDIIEIDDDKLEPLDDSEIESAIEVNVSSWANEQVNISWETLEEVEHGGES